VFKKEKSEPPSRSNAKRTVEKVLAIASASEGAEGADARFATKSGKAFGSKDTVKLNSA